MGTLLARLIGVDAGYGTTTVLSGIDLDVSAGRQLAVLGPSGAGKSTLLRLLTGQLAPRAGTVWFADGRPREGVVHQSPLLFDWLTVGENIDLGLGFAANASVDRARSAELVHRLGLAALVDAYPDEISGGQAQRVALARALAISPALLLLDEPFSALDPATRAELQTWLRTTAVADELTSVFITHDIDEALILADDIVLIGHAGRILHRWTCEPAADHHAALTHPLRTEIRAAYQGDDVVPATAPAELEAVGV